jgi:4'-phosphopantetheinyl transferase
MNLQKGELHIWRYTLNEQDYNSEKNLPILSTEEQEKYKRFLNQLDAVKYICNHRFMRHVLSRYLNTQSQEIKYNYTALGKPSVKNSDLFFSLSHRNKYGLLAISKDNEVGIDIEQIKKLQDVSTFASFSFTEKEKAIIFNNDQVNQESLFTFWTFKEAFIKATGTGLSVDISKINLSDFFYNKTNALPFDNNNLWTIEKINAEEGYKAAFAIKGKVGKCVEFCYDKN